LSNKNGLASAYTMQAEREIHRKHVERSGATAPLAATTSHWPCVSESEFGDNVELF